VTLAQPASIEEPPALGEAVRLASRIARHGYGESVIRLALCRKGVADDVARLVAASAVCCHASIAAAEHRLAPEGMATASGSPQARTRIQDLRTARAASKALSMIMGFVVFVVVGVGGGAFPGKSIGFGEDMERGLDRIVTALEQALAR